MFTGLLALPAEIKLKIVLAAATYSSVDRETLRSFLSLCRDFYELLRAKNPASGVEGPAFWPQIVEHYTLKVSNSTINSTEITTYWRLFIQAYRNTGIDTANFIEAAIYLRLFEPTAAKSGTNMERGIAINTTSQRR